MFGSSRSSSTIPIASSVNRLTMSGSSMVLLPPSTCTSLTTRKRGTVSEQKEDGDTLILKPSQSSPPISLSATSLIASNELGVLQLRRSGAWCVVSVKQEPTTQGLRTYVSLRELQIQKGGSTSSPSSAS